MEHYVISPKGIILNRKLIIGTCGILLLSGMVGAYFGFAKSDGRIAMQVDEARGR